MRGFELAVDAHLTLVLAEARFAEPLAALIDANREHLYRFDPWALELADVTAARAKLASGMHGFASGDHVPTLLVSDGELAGALSLHVDLANRSAEIGYWLAAEFVGRGLATRAVRALSRFAFEELGLVRVSAQLSVENSASRAVLQRAGFQHEGVQRSGGVLRGAVVDLELWSLLPGDLPSSPAG